MSGAHEVLLTEDAEQDLEDIYRHIARSDSQSRANYVLQRLVDVADSLAHLPDRGARPKELLDLGIKDFRQVFFKPYRIIYRTIGDRVLIYLVTDGRRDMQALLARRLLGS